LKYLGANSGVDGVSNCVLSRLGGPVVVGIWDQNGTKMGGRWIEHGLKIGILEIRNDSECWDDFSQTVWRHHNDAITTLPETMLG
jgi:hypothetical protein